MNLFLVTVAKELYMELFWLLLNYCENLFNVRIYSMLYTAEVATLKILAVKQIQESIA